MTSRNIFVALDETSESVAALKFVLANLVQSEEDTVTLIPVIKSDSERESTFAHTKTLLTALHDTHPSPAKFSIQILIAAAGPNSAGQALCDLAAAAQPDMLVLGSAGKSALEGLASGSVSQHVLAHAACPVLVARVSPADETRLASRVHSHLTALNRGPVWI
ncbi:hypothetical protein BC830DRAFT_1132026 [Chytriomyces sp. MP71]|nr:hypothetical protein BC830DRAFT_1132026 [Chytriomyces sp. MP71]